MNLFWKSTPLPPSTLVLLAILAGCTSNPKLWSYDEGKTEAGSYDERAEVALGSQQHKEIVTSAGIVEKADLSEYVAAVGQRVAAVSDRADLKWEFTILDLPTPTAFATRGGYVYITRGMLALLNSESELAAVLAHEIAHVCTRDAVRADNRGIQSLPGGTPPEALPVVLVVSLVVNIAALNIGRHDELKADRNGAQYLRRAGYSPIAMSAALETLVALDTYRRDHNRSAANAPGWLHGLLASHPSLDERKRAFEQTGNPLERIVEPEFLARLDGLDYGSKKSTVLPGDTADRPKPNVLRIRSVGEGDSFATLAKAARGIPDAESRLRLLNQRYPSGELVPEELVKVIE